VQKNLKKKGIYQRDDRSARFQMIDAETHHILAAADRSAAFEPTIAAALP
jgi:hypothetical protein